MPASPVTAMLASAPCLIVNPRSFRAARGGLAARALALGRRYGAELIESADPATLASALDRALAAGPRPIFIVSGDGTVQALMDQLVARYGDALPPVLALGGGRSNLTAVDVGGGGSPLAKLERALTRQREGETFATEDRPLLVIEQAGAPAHHGFFVAGGLIDAAIRDARKQREAGEGFLQRGAPSTAWYLLKLALLALRGRSPLRAEVLQIDASGLGTLHGANRVLIATTLQHREGLFDPYAVRGDGMLRITAIAAQAPRFWRFLPGILCGRFAPELSLENGYLSGRCAQLTVRGLRGYSLDGEAFATDPALPVTIRTGATIRFLQP